MALTSTITLDLVGATQILNYYESATLTDTITYSSNSITFATTPGFNLSKSDTLLYNSLFQLYFTALVLNFPVISKSNNALWPLSSFQISETSQGVTHINYAQTSVGSPVLGINYVPLAGSAAFASRSQITITLQEFFMTQIMLAQYSNQVGLN
jgi:hypothetical protein